MIIKLTIPYENLCPDNQEFGAMVLWVGGKPSARLYLSAKYKEAKLKTAVTAQTQYRGKPLECDLELHGTLYTPTARKTDANNFSKQVHDSLQGVVYVNDWQIARSIYVRGGVSRVDARLEIVITPLDMQEAA